MKLQQATTNYTNLILVHCSYCFFTAETHITLVLEGQIVQILSVIKFYIIGMKNFS